MQEIIKKILEPGTWKISHSDIYTYVNYKVMGTIQSSLMIPNGSSETITIKDGKCIISQPVEDYLKPMGFNGIHRFTEIDEYTYEVACDEVISNDHTPQILKIKSSFYCEEDGRPVECVEVTIKL